MIAAAKKTNRPFEAIIVHKLDRFSRNRDDHVIYKSLLKKIGISVYSVTEQNDPDTPHGFLLEGILEVISEFYNMNLKAETMKGLTENAKKGYHNGGRAPYGYRLCRAKDKSGVEKTTYILGRDEEISIVKRIFTLFTKDNLSAGKVASVLNEESIPSYYGNKWTDSSIKRILRNEAYIGNLVWNMYSYAGRITKKPPEEWIRFTNSHPAIIKPDVFNEAQRILIKT